MRESATGTAGVASVGRSRVPVVANRRLKRAASLSLRKALFGSDGIETRHRLSRFEVDKLGEVQAVIVRLRCPGLDWGSSPAAIAVPQRPAQGAKALVLFRRCFRRAQATDCRSNRPGRHCRHRCLSKILGPIRRRRRVGRREARRC
jgi:hypothetical protein